MLLLNRIADIMPMSKTLKPSSGDGAARRAAGLWIRLERSPPDSGPRYYEIALTRDLWGAPILLRAWGGVGGRRGGGREERFQTLTDARRAASTWLRAKRRRGYRKA